MNRLVRRILAVGLIFVVSTGWMCSKDNLVRNAEQVINSLTTAKPLIVRFVPAAGPKIDQGLSIAGKLKTALQNSQSNEAFGYLHDLIVVFEDIVEHDIPQIHDPAVITSILAALAIADIALSFLANHIPHPVAAAQAKPKLDRVSAFAKKEVWGNRFKK